MNSEYVVWLDAEAARGFVVTAAAYRSFVREGRLGPSIAQGIRRLRAGRDLRTVAAEIRSAFRDAPMPAALTHDILAAYDELGGDVVVRCSPIDAADGVEFLHLHTGTDVLAACRRCFASLFSPVAISNREATGTDHLNAVMPVTVRPMVRAPDRCLLPARRQTAATVGAAVR